MSPENKGIPEILRSYIPVVKALGKTLGKHFEIVLHDVTKTESSIIAIENSHITNRTVGSPSTDFLIDLINGYYQNRTDMELNYITRTRDGKQLKSSTVLIKNEKGEVIGALCINIDLTSIKMAQNFLGEISTVEKKKEPKEKFPEDAEDFLHVMIENSLNKANKPVPMLTKEDKLKIVSYLDKNNIFNIKGAVDMLAEALNVSRYTIYNYLDESRVSASRE
ncbi:helix-turn-helix transcriptional regulator [Halothermothrix orenii]|uniref:YheO domain protein n=1 Tax=Halothermothrix orenii (strain H 168 / OCM 544 / DSM 9562) TaxID=373903 RepID=B8CZY2_HALOH|nr:helix-turn-helix transcriptional regulator [Halothermothrix orenii]ACL70834.1 YheO domain protein [Halothermothrix orenii H 168]